MGEKPVCIANSTRDTALSRNHETKSRGNLKKTAWHAKSKTAYKGKYGKRTRCTTRQTAHVNARVGRKHDRDATDSCRKCTRVKTSVETPVRAKTRQRKSKHAAMDFLDETHGSEAKGRARSPVAGAAALRRDVSQGSVLPRRPRRKGLDPVFLAPCSRDRSGEKGLYPLPGGGPV